MWYRRMKYPKVGLAKSVRDLSFKSKASIGLIFGGDGQELNTEQFFFLLEVALSKNFIYDSFIQRKPKILI